MNRRKARENAFFTLFAASFGTEVPDVMDAAKEDEQEFIVDAFGEELLRLYMQNAPQIDARIEENLKGWKVKRLQKVNLALLRLAVAEMLYGEPDMDSIVINETVELAKRYGDESDYQFINGVLGTISRQSHPQSAPGEGEV